MHAMHKMAAEKATAAALAAAGSTDKDEEGGALFQYAKAGERYRRLSPMRPLQSQRHRQSSLSM